MTNNIELINVVPFNPLISKCQIKVCWVGNEPNRNSSIITKDVARNIANSLPGSPIVGYYNENTEDFEEHNKIIEISNGKFELKPTTKPYGFVDLEAKAWFQKFLDADGVEREYLVTEGWLWTGQFPECQRVIDKGNNQSMELSEEFLDAHWAKDINSNKKFFIINEAIISKLCILGEEFTPCFESANITAPQVEFSLGEDFKSEFFSIMNEIKNILNKGGAPVFTTYAVEIGDSLWSALYDHLVTNYPDEDYGSVYAIEGIYEEEDVKFAIVRNCETMQYYRLNFSLTEEGFVPAETLIEVEKEFVPVETPMSSLDAYSEFVAQYAENKKKEEEKEDEEEKEEICEECGKPLDECECHKDKEVKYVLEEIVEYMELLDKYSALENTAQSLQETIEQLKAENESLNEFKASVEKEQKIDLINSFYMLSDELKEDVLVNIDSYSLEDIESKLSILCVRNKVSFDLDNNTDPVVYNLGGGNSGSEDVVPEWIKAIQDVAKKL